MSALAMPGAHTVQVRLERVSFAPRVFISNRRQVKATFQPVSENLLTEISFQVLQGEQLAIVGASGAGKTLLLRLLNRLNEPTSGTIFFRDRAYAQISPMQLRQQVVLVPQEPKLLGMTVQQTLEYPLQLRQLPPPIIQQRVRAWLDQLHIPSDWLDRTELQLSVGQRQLVTIARALLIQPAVLLLDEPTAALDVGRGQQLLEVLSAIAQAGETSILMANHQLELAQAFCTRILHLEQGNLIQDLPAAQMDWAGLRQNLVHAEAQHQDWD